MKKQVKGFVIGLIVATLLMGTVFAAGGQRTIDVFFNSVNLTVNDDVVRADNILYEGTTYVPLRSIAEMLDKDVGWDQPTRTASINDKAIQSGPITIDQVPVDIAILDPNSIGTVYMNAEYTNNTKYPITSISMKVLLKDTNKTTYLSNHDTVLPGETSPTFRSFGPSTLREEDYEILTIDVRARNTNGKTLLMEYDTKLKEYEYSEYDY